MKNWNKPEIEEINVTLTMSGQTASPWEEVYITDKQLYYPGSN